MKAAFVFLVLFGFIFVTMAEPDWAKVEAKYEGIISSWLQISQKGLASSENPEASRNDLKAAEKMLSTYLTAEIFSKLTELEIKIKNEYDPVIAVRTIQNKKKLDEIFDSLGVGEAEDHHAAPKRAPKLLNKIFA